MLIRAAQREKNFNINPFNSISPTIIITIIWPILFCIEKHYPTRCLLLVTGWNSSSPFSSMASRLFTYLFALYCFSLVDAQLQMAARDYSLLMAVDRDLSLPEDDILLPRNSTECPAVGNNLSPACRKFNALVLGGCWCSCSRVIGGKQTFFEGSKSCQRVSLARQRSGNFTC